MDEEKSIPVNLRADGLLWLINRVVFHPRGFALAVDSNGNFSILGDGSDVWSFTSDDDDKHFADVEAILQQARQFN